MRFASSTIRSLAVLAVALVAGAVFAAPASGAHPERPPRPFTAEQVGEDRCTYFMTFGQASFPAFHPPEEASVRLWGETAIATAPGDRPCVPVVPHDRRIEFTAYMFDGLPVAAQQVPVDSSGQYDITLVSGRGIDYVTAAVCVDLEAPPPEDRCGEPAVIEADGPDLPEPYCQYRYFVTAQWGSGFTATVELTPLVEEGTTWRVVIREPIGTTVQSVWGATAVDDGSTTVLEPPGWGGPIPVGSSLTVGFMGSGSPPAPQDVEAFINGESCDAV